MLKKIAQNLSTCLPLDFGPASANALVALTYPAAGQFTTMASEYLPINEIGIHDEFFALGRRSLPAARRLPRIQEQFAGESALRDGFIKRMRPAIPQTVGVTRITGDRVEKSC